MKAPPTLIAIWVGLTVAVYAQSCPDPKSQRAAIGGDTINAYVSLQQRPVKAAQVRLLSNGKTIWVGSTSDVGSFQIDGLWPGTYSLIVKGWGSATIRISPSLTHSFGNGEMLDYFLMLKDNGCVWTVRVAN